MKKFLYVCFALLLFSSLDIVHATDNRCILQDVDGWQYVRTVDFSTWEEANRAQNAASSDELVYCCNTASNVVSCDYYNERNSSRPANQCPLLDQDYWEYMSSEGFDNSDEANSYRENVSDSERVECCANNYGMINCDLYEAIDTDEPNNDRPSGGNSGSNRPSGGNSGDNGSNQDGSTTTDPSEGGSTTDNSPSATTGYCKGLKSTFVIIGHVISLAKILIPIVIIGFGIMDLFKAITGSKDDEIKKAIRSIIMRAIAGVCIFFLPAFIDLIFGWVDGWNTNYQSQYEDCFRCIWNVNSCK